MTLANYDYDTENADLQQKQKLAQAMQQSGLSPMDTNLGWGVRASPLNAIAKMVQAYMGGKMVEDVKGQQTQLASRYKADAQSGLNDFINGISKQPGTVDPGVQVAGTQAPGQTGAPEGNNPSAFVPPTVTTADDARRAHVEAISRAMASNHPILQQLAASQAGKMLSPQMLDPKLAFEKGDERTQQWILDHPNQPIPGNIYHAKQEFHTVGKEDAPVMVGGTGTMTPATTAQPAPGGAPVAGQPGAPSAFPDVPQGFKVLGEKNGFRTLQAPNGEYFSQSGLGQMVKLDQAPKTTVNLSPTAILQQGQKKGVEKLFEDAAGAVKTMGEKAQAANGTLQSLQNLRQLDQNGIYSNAPAAATTFLANVAQSMGINVDKDKLANTEAYKAEATRVWQQIIAQAGGNRGITSQEAEQLKAMSPQEFQSPQGRQVIYGMLENAARRQQTQFANAHKNFAQAAFNDDPRMLDPTLFGAFNPQPIAPTQGVAPAPKAPTVSRWPGSN